MFYGYRSLEDTMGKEKSSKKEDKKKPAKTLKEKRAEKKQKHNTGNTVLP